MDAADAHRQAHRPGRAEDRRVFGRGGGDRSGGGDPPDRTRVTRSAAAPDAGSIGENYGSRPRIGGFAGRRLGRRSHAGVVARGMGRPCVAGAGDLRIDYEARTIAARATLVKAGEVITIDGSAGEVMVGEVPTIQPELSGDFATLMGWADAIRRLKVRANAETAADARTARRFGAVGIGLTRTEHMFFQADRIGAMRRVLMAEDETGRRAGLAELLPIQREDFAEIFRIMKGFPVTIRLLDPPLHEFLPKTEAEFGEMARLTGNSVA